jgi:hypothetical protein
VPTPSDGDASLTIDAGGDFYPDVIVFPDGMAESGAPTTQ